MRLSVRTLRRSLLRIGMLLGGVLSGLWLLYALWSPGLDVIDGRHDRGDNGIWLGHGWLGDDGWFQRYHKEAQIAGFRDRQRIRALARRLRQHHIRDLFPHLCPTTADGEIQPVDATQTERFLDETAGLRVVPWIGGVYDASAFPASPRWRAALSRSVRQLLTAHPRLAGVQVNVEPWPSGDPGGLRLLEELRAALPPGKILSVAAYPPPTRLHPGLEVHWTSEYYQQVAQRTDQVAVMLYDTALVLRKPYIWLMRAWTREVLDGAGRARVLLGVPAYEDRGVGWHSPDVENIPVALTGIHRALDGYGAELPASYQGVAIYSEWEMTEAKWRDLGQGFVSGNYP